jgi:hypothetical protein
MWMPTLLACSEPRYQGIPTAPDLDVRSILGGIPVIWKSSLMTVVCLSTLEAEYQALSTALKQLIGFKLLIEELTKYFQFKGVEVSISTTVWEDNQGALYLATNQPLTSRTKYFHVK